MTADEVVIRFSRDEALVLFEWVHRNEAREIDFGDLVEHQAERVALWSLSCLLEAELIEPFHPDYLDQVAAARARLTAEEK